jgi:hypothetical protein
LKRVIAFAVVLLFFGVTVLPAVQYSVVQASFDNDSIDVSVQTCGMDGVGNTMVRLTRTQCQHLEEYFQEIHARLNQTENREDTVLIFKEAVVELAQYGLLPKKMNIEQAQRLVTRSAGLIHQRESPSDIKGISNLFCLITGRATNCTLAGILATGIQLFFYLLSSFFYYGPHYWPSLTLLGRIWASFYPVFVLRNEYLSGEILSLFSPFNLMAFGFSGFGHGTSLSKGWVSTFGMLGKQKYSGSFSGSILYPVMTLDKSIAYTGVFGFTGFKIFFETPTNPSFFLGTALRVHLDATS